MQFLTNPQKPEEQKTSHNQLKAFAMWAIPFAFALVLAVQPVSAEINLSVITETVNAFIGLIEPITSLVIAIVPLWFVIMILGFIMGLLAAILNLIQSGMRFH